MARPSQKDDIVIAGYDMVTPLGTELEAEWEAFAAGRSGVRWIGKYEVQENDAVRVAGEVPTIDFSSFNFYSERDEANWFSPVIFHSMLVAKRALAHAGLTIGPENAGRIGTTFSSAIGGLDAMILAEEKVRAGKTPHPFTNPNGCLNLVAGKVSILTGAQGPIFSPVAACATGAASVASAAMLLRGGQADAVIAGACDFPVIRSLFASFASMNGAFKSFKTGDRGFENPAAVSRPFSKDRKGFVISEGAAALIVTTRGYAEENSLAVRGVVEGIGMTSDAKHYVAPNLPTIVTCMREAIRNAGGDIYAVNAHAASTNVGDAVEIKAIKEVFGDDRELPITANKSQIGHTMGASSGIELILALEGMARGVILPTLNYESDTKLPPIDPVAEGARPFEHHRVLSNSFGFGGCNVCIVIGHFN
ncbi:MAG: beta-ketoacyl-[acyl-carrier-protein] synthase family protein [Deltaproteobacteria bacterium]|nr:beta-ketoacyl-[acyl-carrier-protein] synthase family protein [Deltaproteobacteria bacterium]